MIRTYLIPLLAIVGLLAALVTVVRSGRPADTSPPVVAPPEPPYPAFVAGSGIIEPESQIISVGSPVGAIVDSVQVVVGADVAKGDALFRLDTRDLVADLASREAAVAVARATLDRLLAGTRPELIPPAQARLAEAQAHADDMQAQLLLWEQVGDARAVSRDDLDRRRFALASGRARAQAAAAELDLLRAGSWEADIAVARAQVQQAQAQRDAVQVEIDRRVVRAPIAGRVLQVNVRPGEFAPAGAATTPLMILGTVSPLHVRVDVDEYQSWRVARGAPAVAFARGNRSISAQLEFVRFEPYIVPKKSLTGDSAERVDTRVLQVLYRFHPADLPLYVGQQVDVFIQSAASAIRPQTTPEKEPRS
jgi:HlyD family secretion protein